MLHVYVLESDSFWTSLGEFMNKLYSWGYFPKCATFTQYKSDVWKRQFQSEKYLYKNPEKNIFKPKLYFYIFSLKICLNNRDASIAQTCKNFSIFSSFLQSDQSLGLTLSSRNLREMPKRIVYPKHFLYRTEFPRFVFCLKLHCLRGASVEF